MFLKSLLQNHVSGGDLRPCIPAFHESECPLGVRPHVTACEGPGVGTTVQVPALMEPTVWWRRRPENKEAMAPRRELLRVISVGGGGLADGEGAPSCGGSRH